MIALLLADPPEDMVDVFRRSEFDRSPSWWSRMWTSIGDFFDGLSFSWLGPVGQFVVWLLLIGVVIALVAWIWRTWRSGGFRRRRKHQDDDSTEVVPISVDDLSDPEELAVAGAAAAEELDYRLAIVLRYRELVLTLVGARLVSSARGRTTGELRADFAGTVADHAAFDEATAIFEVIWFSDYPPSREEYERMQLVAGHTFAAVAATTGGAA